MKKKSKLGRPRAKTLAVPAWATKRIEELAKLSGVAPDKTLELALKMGLYAVKDQYAGLIQFQESADQLFYGEPEDEPLPVTRSSEETEGPEPEPEPELFPDPAPEVAGEPEPEEEVPAENGSYATAL